MDKKRCLVVNLIGGPGCGKSTTTAGLFYELKKKGYNCEMSLEFAKDKVYEESFRIIDDQIYIFGKQFHKFICMFKFFIGRLIIFIQAFCLKIFGDEFKIALEHIDCIVI